jgi:hypothetical protein
MTTKDRDAFTIGCRWLDSYENKTFVAKKATAQEVLVAAESFERSDVRIEYIDTPDHGRLDMWGFRKLYGDQDK